MARDGAVMAYTRATLQEITDRVKADMEARVSDGGAAIPPTSLLGILASVMSGASYLTQGFLEWISNQVFADTADETGLTRWGAILGIPRQPATYTTGAIFPTGTTGVVVPSGTAFQNTNGAVFLTQASFTIDTTVSVAVEAEDPGINGNTDEPLSLVSPLAGVDTEAAIVSGFDDGEDQETLDAWRYRILQRFQNPPAGGTVADYEAWALLSDGVAYAWCFNAANWNGAGTVGLAVSGADFDELDAGTVAQVQADVDALRPVAANLTVYSPEPLDVEFDISISPLSDDLKAAITASVRELYETDAAPGGTMLLSRLHSAIAAAGPADYTINKLTVDTTEYDPPTNYTVTKVYVPRVGSFVWSAVP